MTCKLLGVGLAAFGNANTDVLSLPPMKTKPIITTTPSTVPTTPASLLPPKAEAFIGIDFHKR